MVDVIGAIDQSFTNLDSQGNQVNDPYPTPFPSGGFDLDAVGAINFIPTAIEELNNRLNISFYPNPTKNVVYFNFENQDQYKYLLTNMNGKAVSNGLLNNELDLRYLKAGIYFIHISSNDKYIVKKIIKK